MNSSINLGMEKSLNDEFEVFVQRNLCRVSLFEFVKHFWDVIIQDKPVYNWHIEYLCSELEIVAKRVFERKEKEYDLIINIPPGTSKTTLCTIMFPVWCWINDPSLRFITASYSSDLSTEHAVKSRDIVRSDKFKELFPHISLKKDQDNKKYYQNNHNGSRSVTSVGGTVTGKHAHIIILDDPMNPQEANSEKERQTSNKWVDNTLTTRKVDKGITPTITIMQRLHEKDTTGHLLAKEGKDIKHICLPDELTKDVKPESVKTLYKNGLLDEVRLSRKIINDARIDLGSFAYSGQFKQTPSPEEGGFIKKKWFASFGNEDLREDMSWDFVCDPAYTSSETNDPSALIAFSFYKNDFYLLSYSQKWLEFPDLIKHIQEFSLSNKYSHKSKILVEPKASGKSIVQTLKKQTGLNIIESKSPNKDKVARVQDCLAVIEAGRIKLYDGKNWDLFIDECAKFPNAEHDDLVDCLSIIIDRYIINSKRIIASV